MCNLYSMTKNTEAIRKLFRVSHNRAIPVDPLPAIFPGHQAPIVRKGADGELELTTLSWGFVLPQAGKAPKRVTNTRDDKVLTSTFWRSSFEERCCLVPVTSFCEPTETTPSEWVWFALKDDDPRPLFAFAGIWRHHKGPIKKDGPSVDLDVYSFMTTRPNELTVSINHERSPVLLSGEEQFRAWLDGSPQEALSLVKPFDAGGMRIVQRGKDKQDKLEDATTHHS